MDSTGKYKKESGAPKGQVMEPHTTELDLSGLSRWLRESNSVVSYLFFLGQLAKSQCALVYFSVKWSAWQPEF